MRQAVGHLAEMTWEEARAAAGAGAIALVPMGSLEQHGPHLPVRVDTVLVTEVAAAAVDRLPEGVRVVLAPTLWLGASHHHLPFFAVSVQERTYVEVVVQIGCSLADAGFRRLFFLNGHGGNAAPLRLAVNEIARARPATLPACAEYWALGAPGIRAARTTGPGGAAHACEVETSLMLHLAPAQVRRDRLRPDVPELPPQFVRDLVDGGPVALGIAWERLSTGGVLGDPTQATAAKGAEMLAACAAGVAEALAAFAGLEVRG